MTLNLRWLFLLPLFLSPPTCRGSNWAQVTGPIQQNNVIPVKPKPGVWHTNPEASPGKDDHWSARKGHAIVVVPYNGTTGQLSAMFVLGGDSFVHDSTSEQHASSLMSDVWYTYGVTWKVGYFKWRYVSFWNREN